MWLFLTNIYCDFFSGDFFFLWLFIRDFFSVTFFPTFEWRTGGRGNRVPILCNQLLLQLLTQIFETLQNVWGHIEDVHEAVWCHLMNFSHIFHVVVLCHFFAENAKGRYLFCVISSSYSFSPRPWKLCRMFMDILKICMNQYDAI